jgi:Mg2+ and Co2+ transporter CorA
VWSYARSPDGAADTGCEVPPNDRPFRWLHLNLSDQRSLRWLNEQSGLPPALLAMMVSRDERQRFAAEPDGIGLILHDFERGFDPASIGQVGALYAALVPGLLVTGRIRPLHGADLLRARLEKGATVTDGPSAFTFLIETHVDSLASLVLDLSADLLRAEADLLAEDEAPDTRELIAARRQCAQLHRMIGGLRATLMRLEREPGLPADLAGLPRTLLPRLAGLEADIVSAQQQLRLLRDELDLQAAQRTNENVYLLSVMTALMMPATIVTGFFGMNTGGLPFAQGPHGTLLATLVALLSAAGSYWLLRLMGLVRRQ